MATSVPKIFIQLFQLLELTRHQPSESWRTKAVRNLGVLGKICTVLVHADAETTEPGKTVALRRQFEAGSSGRMGFQNNERCSRLDRTDGCDYGVYP